MSSGWTASAGLMLMIAGALQAVEGLAALFSDTHYAGTADGLVVPVTYNRWGWLLVALAAVSVIAGHGVLRARSRARIWAIGAAVAGIITNLVLTGAYPIWTAVLMVVDIIVICVLCVRWDETH